MPGAKQHLDELLALAAERRWTALARELASLVLDWPQEYPAAMRAPVLALFERALRECDEAARAEIAPRMGGRPDLPLKLLNELYLAAPAPLRREILMRNELERDGGAAGAPADAALLLRAARNGGRGFAAALSGVCAVPNDIAEAILADKSGEPLAVLCRGAGLDRAIFSSIAILRAPQDVPLNVYDTVPEHAARRLTGQWRSYHAAIPELVRAAE